MSDYLCDSLLFEIFTRLPPKSLLRFRSLSKSWYSCISSPGFIRMHTSRSPQKLLIRTRHRGQTCMSSEGFYTLHLENGLQLCPRRGYMGISQVESPYSEIYYIACSCNGILCVLDYENNISLWNSSIRRRLALPNCLKGYSSCLVTGFGFDPMTEDYKIVCIYFSNGGNGESSFVHAMKTGTWCAIASPIPLLSYVASKACFVNGALHWVVRYLNKSNGIDWFYIMTFDLSTHVFGTIELPRPGYKVPRLTTIQGSLGLISMDDDDDISWIWAKRDSSWSLVFKLKTDRVGGGIMGVLQTHNNGDMLLVYDWNGVYNSKTGAWSRLADFNTSSCIVDIERYAESLHWLDMESACERNHLLPIGEKK